MRRDYETGKPHIYRRRGWWEARAGRNGKSLTAVSSFRGLVKALQEKEKAQR